jgi:hypothetical protein
VSNRILLRQDLPFHGRLVPGVSFDGLRSCFSASLSIEILISILLIFSPLLQGGTTHLAVMINRLLILSLFAVCLSIGIRAGALPWPVLKIAPAVLAYLGLACLSVVRSPYPDQSLQWLMVLLSYAVLLYILVSFLGEWDHIIRLLVVLIGIGIGESCLAIAQGGLFGTIRPSGTFFNPNFLSGYVGAVCTIVLSYLCYLHVGRLHLLRISWLSRVGLFASLCIVALFLGAMIRTESRGGLMSMLVGVTLVIGLRFGRKGLGVLVLLIAVGILIPNSLRERFQVEHAQNPVGYARFQIWQSSVNEMLDYPLGVGIGLYQYVYPRYAFPIEGQIARYGTVAHTAHNEYLQMGVELGAASILIFSCGVAVVIREATWVLRQRLRRWQRGLIVGVSGATAGILVHAAVDSNLHEPAVAIILTLCVGIIFSIRRLATGEGQLWRIFPMRPRLIWAGAGILIVGILALIVVRLGLGWMAYESGAHALDRGNFAEAIAQYRAAVTLNPGKALYHSSIAATYFQMFERSHEVAIAQAAVDELKSAIRLNPLDGRLSALLGHIYTRLASSAPRLDTALESYNKNRSLWMRQAVVAYERAIELDPFAPFYLLELGRLHHKLGERQTGLTYVQRAVEMEPNFLPGREWLANAYLELDQPGAARQEYLEIVDRQQRYAGWNKDPLEMRFLKVDVGGLTAVLGKERRGA